MSLADPQGCPCCLRIPSQRSSWRLLCEGCFLPWSSLRECDGRGHPVSLVRPVSFLKVAS